MSFYGYYPMDNQNFKMVSSATTKGLPTYEYTVPADVTEQADVMTGAIIDEKGGEHPSPLNMVFHHRLADISFSVHNTASEPMTFKSLTFMGLKYHGTLNDDVWTITGDRNTESTSPFVLTPNAIIDADATAFITENNTHMMMIPQTIPSGTTILKVVLAIGDEEQEFEYSLEKDMSFTSGKSYNLCLEAGETYIIINAEDTSINDWEAEEKDLSVGGVSTDDEWSQPSINGNGDVTIKDWEKE
jgi:hypothetical protein